MSDLGDNLSKRLAQLSERLVNVTRRNKSIRLLRKAKAQCFDLGEAEVLSPGVAARATRSIVGGKPHVVLSWKDSPVDPREARHQLLIDDNDALEEVETPEFRLLRQFRKLDSNLTHLSRNASRIEEETGAVDLYLGFPFLTGTCDDTEGTFLQAPLVLFPVTLRAERAPRLQWTVAPRPDAEPIFNEALALALEQYHETKFSEEFIEAIEAAAESDDAAADPLWLIQWLHARFADMGLRMSPPVAAFAPVPEYRAHEVPDDSQGFSIKAFSVIGYFPQADSSLRHDYDKLIEMAQAGQLNGDLARLLDSQSAGTTPIDADPQDAFERSSMDSVPESQTNWIINSDASQEAAMLRSREESCLVLHGPPGTGKSQVICNMIADALSRGQRVVVCCQKRAALDVVFQRLDSAGLGDHIALVHDHANDRAELYARIAQALEPLSAESLRSHEREVTELAQSIDETTARLREIASELHRERPCGFSARELYLKGFTSADQHDLDIARASVRFNRQSLERFTERLDRLQALQSRLGSDAWKVRKSFSRFSPGDAARMKQALQAARALTEELQRCREAARKADQPAQPLYAAADDLLALASLRSKEWPPGLKPMVQELLLPGRVGALKATLAALGKQLPELRKLPERPDNSYAEETLETAGALEHWCRKHRSLLRIFSGSFRRARQLTTAYFARIGATATPEAASAAAGSIRAAVQWNKADKAARDTVLQEKVAQCSAATQLDELVVLAQEAASRAAAIREVLERAVRLDAAFQVESPDLEAVIARAIELLTVAQALGKAATSLEALSFCVRDEHIAAMRTFAGTDPAALAGLLAKLEKGLADFDSLQAIDDIRDELGEVERAVYQRVSKQSVDSPWAGEVEKCVVIGWLDEVERSTKVLRQVSTGDVASLRSRYRKELERRRELNQRQLALQLKQRATSVRFKPGREVDGRHNAEKPWKDLKHQVGKKRRLWPLRKLVHELEWPLFEVMPCWLVSPDTLSASFPLQPGLFDAVIFDEASQLAVQNGVPAFYRAKRVVVAGDEQQLRPFDLFGALGLQADAEQAETEDDEAGDAAAVESESILTLAKARFPEEMLSCHYRSKYEELIEFSNQGFYKGRLQTVPAADGLDQTPIEWIKVEGTWEKRRNRREAEAVVELLLELLRRHTAPGVKSIGVITFNDTQREEVLDQIDRRAESDPEFAALIGLARSPASGNIDSALFVKNIENVQGDERDIIIFSVGYAPESPGERVRSHFGSLNKEGGDNRLNVAISRARERIYVISSIHPEDLNVAQSKNRGPRLLQKYLEYARAVGSRSHDVRDAVLRSIGEATDVHAGAPGNFDSPMEEQVFDELRKRGLLVQPQVGVSGYRIDLGIVDPDNPSRYLLGIECDGATYHRARSARERDAYRQRFLESRGWFIHRIWSRNWWRNKNDEIAKVVALIEQLRGAQV